MKITGQVLFPLDADVHVHLYFKIFNLGILYTNLVT